MKRSSLFVSTIGLAGLLASCTPDVTQNPKPNVVFMEFDPGASPPVVPQPNDLAIDPVTGLVTVPPSPTDTPAQIEFNRTYLNTLDGFPMESVASAPTSADLNPSTLATGVIVLDITNPAAPAPVAATPSYTAGSHVLTIPPPGGAWMRGHEYAVTVVGGSQSGAVQGSSGQQVTGSSTWALVSGTTLVCTLPDGGPGGPGSGCLPSTDLICTASGTTGSACANTAAQLQQLQSLYAPLLNALGMAPFNIPRSNVAILWTFRITSQAEVAFSPDPTNPVFPFPNDVFLSGGHVSLPALPAGSPPALVALIEGLNTLDGFSTTATIQSAVSFDFTGPGASALVQGSIDPTTLSPPLAIGFVSVGGSGASQGDPQVGFCLSDVAPGCPQVSPTLLDGGAKPQVLGIVPLTPLNEQSQYAAYMTNAIRDTTGKAVIPAATFAMVRLVQPIYANGKSQISLLTDAQASQLVQLQAGLAPLFAELGLNGIPRTNVVQAWAFTTQTTVSALQQLAAAPYATSDAGVLPSVPTWALNVTAAVVPQLQAANVPTAAIGQIWVGNITDPFALTSPEGTFNPGLAGTVPQQIPFIMTVPDAGLGVPTGGYPVTIFGHGLTGNRTNAYAIANALASADQVMIAIDEVWHGERGTCTGFGAYLDAALGPHGPLPDAGFPDSLACSNPATMGCDPVGRCWLANRSDPSLQACNAGPLPPNEICFAAGQNECAPDGHCEGGDFAASFSPAAGVTIPVSGWNLINLNNPFASRDSLRQQVIDNSQLARVVSSTATGNLGSVTGVQLNAARLNYSGQSLGGILGTLYSSVAFNVHNAGLNVPGGDVVDIILTSPSFVPLKNGFIAGLAANGVVPDSPVYDLVIDVYRWVLDPADPSNAAYFLTHPTGKPAFPPPAPALPSIPVDRRAFVQWIVDDQTVPNPTTRQLIAAAIHDATTTGLKLLPGTGTFTAYQFNGTSTPYAFNTTTIQTCVRHPFLLAPPPSNACSGTPGAEGFLLTTDAQTQIVTFLAGGPPY
ncbi:MAG TPA: hypothetical protein VEJ89_16240 [Myxococcaceae bacterium]|nr:hypothetical protein [Myxococcaceae bacterium]